MALILMVNFLIWPWLVSSSGSDQSTPTLVPDCTKTTVMTGEMIQEELDSRRISVVTNLRLSLGLRETACLYVMEKHQPTGDDLVGSESSSDTRNGSGSLSPTSSSLADSLSAIGNDSDSLSQTGKGSDGLSMIGNDSDGLSMIGNGSDGLSAIGNDSDGLSETDSDQLPGAMTQTDTLSMAANNRSTVDGLSAPVKRSSHSFPLDNDRADGLSMGEIRSSDTLSVIRNKSPNRSTSPDPENELLGTSSVSRSKSPDTLSVTITKPPDTLSAPKNKSPDTKNGTVIYTISYVSLSQLHPVRQRYEFGIPYFESKCVCDCAGGDDHCPVGFQYKNCTNSNPDTVCATTYFANQPSTGCVKGDESEICCQLSIRPIDGKRYTALYIGQPDAVAEFQYRVLTMSPDGSGWLKSAEETFRVSLNRHQRLEFENNRLEITVNGMKPFYQLNEGMYLYENPQSGTRKVDLKDGVPINQLHEYDHNRLGWFRYRNDRWTVRNAWVRLQDIHRVQVVNCKEQTYTETFNAEYYYSSGEGTPTGPILGHSVIDEEPWIEEIKTEYQDNDHVTSRSKNNDHVTTRGNVNRLIVTHKDSNPIEINLSIDSQIQLMKILYHASALTDFSGSIQVDQSSNRYLNLTLIGARGTLIGTVYRAPDRHSADLAFSHYVNSPSEGPYRTTIALPAQVNTTRWVCIHPVNRVKDEICKWFTLEMVPLDDKESPVNGLTAQRGQCSDCNEVTLNNFLQYLNPMQWINGISSPAEALAMGTEILFYAVFVVIVLALCRRIACPIVRWAVCGGEPWCGSSSKRTTARPTSSGA